MAVRTGFRSDFIHAIVATARGVRKAIVEPLIIGSGGMSKRNC
jgi:hypothetical protein